MNTDWKPEPQTETKGVKENQVISRCDRATLYNWTWDETTTPVVCKHSSEAAHFKSSCGSPARNGALPLPLRLPALLLITSRRRAFTRLMFFPFSSRHSHTSSISVDRPKTTAQLVRWLGAMSEAEHKHHSPPCGWLQYRHKSRLLHVRRQNVHFQKRDGALPDDSAQVDNSLATILSLRGIGDMSCDTSATCRHLPCEERS